MQTRAKNHDILSQVTAIIKTFERPGSLDRLIRSMRRFYPALKIIVGDDSLHPCPRDDVDYLRLAPDTGLGAGRNALVERVATPYFLILDDDYEFTEQTRIERLARLVAEGTVDLAAGDWIRCKRKWFFVRKRRKPFHGTLELNQGHLKLLRGCHSRQDGYLLCDIVHNFFVADTDAVRAMGGWQADLKLNEHVEFFLRLKRRGLRVAFCPDVSILHWVTTPAEYSRYRNRDFRPLAAEKMGVTKWTDIDGETRSYPQPQPLSRRAPAASHPGP